MKLRNKKTGEIIDLAKGHICETIGGESLSLRPNIALSKKYTYSSITELSEEWEDYEEPNEIDVVLEAIAEYGDNHLFDNKYIDRINNLNIAENRLMAWTRLKNKGFRFNKWAILEEPKTPHIKLVIEAEMDVAGLSYELDLLFGGKDETLQYNN